MAVSKSMRFDIFERDGFTCQYCGAQPPNVVLEVDHIHPKSKGGLDNEDNLTTACKDCNRGKGADPLQAPSPGRAEELELQIEKMQQLAELNQMLARQRHEEDIYLANLSDKFYEPWRGRSQEGFHWAWEARARSGLRRYVRTLNYDQIATAIEATHVKFKHESTKVVPYFFGVLRNIFEEANGGDL